jgi:hypothetical protein
MALKITGRTPRLSVSESRHGASEAKQATMKCDLCQKLAFVTFAYGTTPMQRHAGMKAALDEHRKVCTVGTADQQRVYEIWYPRK